MKKTIVDGLKVSMGDKVTEGNLGGIFHGTHFVLVDQEGTIRGYYDSSEEDAIDQVLSHAALLLNRGAHVPTS